MGSTLERTEQATQREETLGLTLDYCDAALSMQRCIELEERLLYNYTGLAESEIEAYHVEISPYCKLRTIEVGFQPYEQTGQAKPKLVFIHGYGASSATFWKIMKPLSEHFHVIFVDLPGMGGSTRVPFFCRSPEQAQDFFVGYLEEWRVAMGKLTDFYLAGHSFGGYIAGLYSLKHSEHIRKLVFVSPIGFSQKPVDWSFQRVRMRKVKDHKGKLIQSNYMINPTMVQQAIAPFIWQYKVSPFKIARTLGRHYCRASLQEFVGQNLSTNGDPELEALLVDYLQCIFMMRGTSEAALFVLFDLGLFAHSPLNAPSKLASPDFPLPISFIFGKHDWVTAEGCQDVLLSNKYRKEGLSQLHVVQKSDHNLASDNPAELAQLIIDDIKGNVSHRFDSKLEMYYLESKEESSFLGSTPFFSPSKSPEKKLIEDQVIHPYHD